MPTKLPQYVGAQRFLEMVNETRYNDNNSGGWYQTYATIYFIVPTVLYN